MSARVAFSVRHHTSFLQLPVERINTDLQCSFCGQCWRLGVASMLCRVKSPLAAPQHPQSAEPLLKVLGSLPMERTDLVLWRFCGLRVLDWENSLGSEREGRVGKKGVLWWGDCCSENCWGGDYWGCFGGDWFGDCCCGGAFTGVCCEVTFRGDWVWFPFSFSVVGLDWVQNFFAFISPLSLRLLRFVVFISSGCSPSMFFFLAFLFCFLLGDGTGCGAGCTVLFLLEVFMLAVLLLLF